MVHEPDHATNRNEQKTSLLHNDAKGTLHVQNFNAYLLNGYDSYSSSLSLQ
jgi:hypothetical protein